MISVTEKNEIMVKGILGRQFQKHNQTDFLDVSTCVIMLNLRCSGYPLGFKLYESIWGYHDSGVSRMWQRREIRLAKLLMLR